MLREKSALVTGGTGGVGSAICRDFLAKGVKDLAVLDISDKEPSIVNIWRNNYPKASISFFSVNVANEKELQNCYRAFVKGIKSLDIVVNCAGILNESCPRKMIEVNLYGTISSTMLAMKYMRADSVRGRGGVIVNISSIVGIYPVSYAPTYCATKSAIIAFTRSLANGHDKMGIKFLTLCPGGTLTRLMLDLKLFDINFAKLLGVLRKTKFQSPNCVSEATVRMIEYGKNGNVWIIENGKLTEHTDPLREI